MLGKWCSVKGKNATGGVEKSSRGGVCLRVGIILLEEHKELLTSRGVSFDDMVDAIQSGGLIDSILHPNVIQYSHQEMYIRRELPSQFTARIRCDNSLLPFPKESVKNIKISFYTTMFGLILLVIFVH